MILYDRRLKIFELLRAVDFSEKWVWYISQDELCMRKVSKGLTNLSNYYQNKNIYILFNNV